MKKMTSIRSKAKKVQKWVLMTRKRTYMVSAVFFITLIGVIFFAMGKSYSVSREVTHSVYTIPEKAVFYAEVLDPAQMYSLLEKSAFGKSLIDSKAWQKLSSTPEFLKLSNLLYFVELKAGEIVSYKDLHTFFGGSAGFAKMEDGSFLVVAKSNVKSKLGLALVSAFKGQPVKMKVKKTDAPESRKLEGVTEGSYTELFDEQKVSFANLEVTRINVQDGYLYLVMAGDYIFISDSDNTLKESLYTASNPSASSIRMKKGMKEALTSFESRGQIFIYTDTKKSSLSPLLVQCVPGDGVAAVIYAQQKKNISGDVFAIGYDVPAKATLKKGVSWERLLPSDGAFSFYSSTLGVNDVVENLNDAGESWKGNTDDFFKEAHLDRSAYFGSRKGVALVLHGMELFNKKLYPQFSVGYSAEKKDSSLYKAFFKISGETPQRFQDVSYVSMRQTAGRFYIPSYYYDKAGIISSNKLNLEKYISASKGNRPVVGDDASYALLGDYAHAPHHIVINIPRVIESLRSFYLYGGEKSGAYTKITVDRDILPLTDPMKGFETLHIAVGAEKTLTGKIVLSDSRK
jgi:hypothetical protein